jgi:hypothetical protein
VVYRLDRFVNYSNPRDWSKDRDDVQETETGTAESDTGDGDTWDATAPIKVDLRAQVTKGQHKRRNPNYGNVKLWADIWEAYWACILWEREIWAEDVDDIKSIFRQLMILKHRELLPLSINKWQPTDTIPSSSTQGEASEASQSPAREISMTDVSEGGLFRCDMLLDANFGPVTDKSGFSFVGYWATHPRLTDSSSGWNYPPFSKDRTTCFGATVKDAQARLLARISDPSKGMSSVLHAMVELGPVDSSGQFADEGIPCQETGI